ncbi:MAG: PD-(D/E)XK nuclease family protein [Candidatus Thorarchaeota archaeon]
MSAASYNIPQRPLQYSFLDSTIKAIPDVISFFDTQEPLIIDWKVHYFGTKDYRLQLTLYAMALKRCSPHKDFPTDLSMWEEDSLRLIEAQLLTNQIREYSISSDDIHKVEDYMIGSITEMRLALDSDSSLTAFDFLPTRYPEACKNCPFKKLCWEQ